MHIIDAVMVIILSLFKDSFPVGSSVQYCCKPGMMIMEERTGQTDTHSRTITCLSTGEWSGQPPKCSSKRRRERERFMYMYACVLN